MSAAIGTPITVLQNAGEGGAWGMALLALATFNKAADFERFVDGIFANAEKCTVSATDEQIKSFGIFIQK